MESYLPTYSLSDSLLGYAVLPYALLSTPVNSISFEYNDHIPQRTLFTSAYTDTKPCSPLPRGPNQNRKEVEIFLTPT